MNEETIAGIVGWGKTLGSIASSITVELHAPGQVRRAAGKSGSRHTVFRVGEVHGRKTDRAQEVCKLVSYADSAMVTENMWGERWSKLVTNVMGNGLSACTGMITRDMVKNDAIRHFSNRLGSEAIRVGQALGYTFDEVSHMDPETIARAGEGDAAATRRRSMSTASPRPTVLGAASTGRRWARTWSRGGAPRSSFSTALSCARARRSVSRHRRTRC